MNAVRRPNVSLDYRRSDLVAWYARRGSKLAQDDFEGAVRSLPEVDFVTFGEQRALGYDNVTELGWVENPEEVLKDCKVILNTSPTEGMPNTTLLGLACGCAAVGVDNPAFRELAGAFAGRVSLYRGGDFDDLAEAVRREVSSWRGDTPLNLLYEDQLGPLWGELLQLESI
ncbi:glycosyltransferase family 4 protein [Dietzia maris]